jgi:hypothetical protein
MNGCLVPVRVTNVHIIHLLDISFMQVALHTERYKCVLFSKDINKNTEGPNDLSFFYYTSQIHNRKQSGKGTKTHGKYFVVRFSSGRTAKGAR